MQLMAHIQTCDELCMSSVSSVRGGLLITGVMSLIPRKRFHLDLVLVLAEMFCPAIIEEEFTSWASQLQLTINHAA